MYDHHAERLFDKRIVFWVRRLSRAKTPEEIERYEAKIDALYAELKRLREKFAK